MTKLEVVKILKRLDCYYRDTRQVDPGEMADAWFDIIGGYDFDDVWRAVIEFAKMDRREYPTFPAPSLIINGMETIEEREQKSINKIRFALTYGKDYAGLDEDLRRYLSKKNYEWIADSWAYVEMVDKARELADLIRKLHREELDG